MKTKRMLLLSGLPLGVLLGHEAQAFYNPSTGRWLSRDPIMEWGAVNLYLFVENGPSERIDLFGLVGMGEVRLRERQCGCKCREVKITYMPGGENFELGFYLGKDLAGGDLGRFFGNAIHVDWTVMGDPKQCKYYQYEKGGAHSTFNGKDQRSRPAAERDIDVGGPSYFDGLGSPAPWVGTYFKRLDIEITFKCVDSDEQERTSKTVHIVAAARGIVHPDGLTEVEQVSR